MPVNDSPCDYAKYLLEHYGDSGRALDHAEWALSHVRKDETKAFWKEVIEELKKVNYAEGL